ncbi:Endothelial lipase [Folsomia candida]|uniref:Endothelial lipase n=1 Tax=Folsomia candida TaxID=158441 RepID=A0A226E7J2_FOLCA|nr:Endothelial lipase [Folsomia candida]
MGFGLLKKETATCQYHTLAPYITSQIFNYTSLLPSAQPTAIHIHIRSSWTNSCILFFPFPTTFPPPTLRAVAFVPLLSNSLTQYTHPSLGEEEGYSSSCHELCEFFSSTRRKPFELIHHLSSSTTIYLLHHHHHHQCMHKEDGQENSARRGRCFTKLWSYFQTRAQNMTENLISGDPNQVRFFLYPDPYNRDYFEEIVYNNVESLAKARYRFGSTWKILIHGYTMSQFGTFPQNVKNAYLSEYRRRLERDRNAEGYNVLIVDWAPLADPKLSGNANFLLMYTFAVRNVQVVGQRVGEMVHFLRQNGGLESYKKVHIVGFSLGAHVSGNAGTTIFNLSGEKIPRITGNSVFPPTNLIINKFTGNVDFYPNGGGPFQPYCYNEFVKAGENRTMGEMGSCSHNRAPFYFAKSISTAQPQMYACSCDDYKHFKNGCDCEDKAAFGEYCDSKTKGMYYLDVDDEVNY